MRVPAHPYALQVTVHDVKFQTTVTLFGNFREHEVHYRVVHKHIYTEKSVFSHHAAFLMAAWISMFFSSS